MVTPQPAPRQLRIVRYDGGMKYEQPLVAPNSDRFVLIEFGDDTIAFSPITISAFDSFEPTPSIISPINGQSTTA